MPLINRVGGGGGAELQSKTVYPNIFTRKETSTGWTSDNNTVEHKPDDGYDGFSSIIVKKPKLIDIPIYKVSCVDYRTLEFDLGDAYSGLSDSAVLKDFFKRVFQFVVFHTASSTATGNEITSCVSVFATNFTNGAVKITEKYIIAHQEGGSYSSRIFSKSYPGGIFTFNTSTLKLTYQIPTYTSDRTDGYGYKFKTSGSYRASFLAYEEI